MREGEVVEIYIVLYEEKSYFFKDHYKVFESEHSALTHAVDIASNSHFRLDKVLKLNTTYQKVTEYELGIVKGQIKLKQKPIKLKQKPTSAN